MIEFGGNIMAVSDVGNNEEKRQGVLTLYGAGSDLNGFAGKVRTIFGQNATELIKKGKNEFGIKLIDDTVVDISIMADPKVVGQQNMGMANFFSKAPLNNEQLMIGCLQQIRLFTCIIGVSFEVTDSRERTSVIIGAMSKAAEEITAFVLYPNMRLFTPQGKLLISVEGESDFTEYYPIMSQAMMKSAVKENDKDKARKAKSIEILKEKNIPYAEGMGVSAYDETSVVPTKEDILRRAICVFLASVKSEVISSGGYENPMEFVRDATDKLEQAYGIEAYLSKEEKAYLADENPTQEDINKFGWRYECCAVLLWALGLFEIGEPNEICDAAELGAIIWNNDFNTLLEKSVIKSKEELLDMQDLIHRYDWACIEAQIKKFELPQLDRGIVFEWHYTLNWLTGVEGVTDWDKVPRKA